MLHWGGAVIMGLGPDSKAWCDAKRAFFESPTMGNRLWMTWPLPSSAVQGAQQWDSTACQPRPPGRELFPAGWKPLPSSLDCRAMYGAYKEAFGCRSSLLYFWGFKN